MKFPAEITEPRDARLAQLAQRAQLNRSRPPPELKAEPPAAFSNMSQDVFKVW